MKKWIATLLLAGFSVLAQAGEATVNNDPIFGGGTVTDPYDLGSLGAGSETALLVGVVGNANSSFLEYAVFNVSETVSVSGVATTLTLGFGWADIDNFTVSLWSGANSVLATFAGNNTTFDLGVLTAGDYSLQFTGTFSPFSDMGTYGVGLVAAPVPEPSTYALMLAGLGLVGFMARRRREVV
jgi:PEP-CTERM motif